jgi:hypothetical protein
MTENLKVSWIDRGFEPTQKPDPNFPNGIDLDLTKGEPTCRTTLPYPAKRCGYFLIDCTLCGLQVLVTTAGRPDDPRSVRLECKKRKGEAHA